MSSGWSHRTRRAGWPPPRRWPVPSAPRMNCRRLYRGPVAARHVPSAFPSHAPERGQADHLVGEVRGQRRGDAAGVVAGDHLHHVSRPRHRRGCVCGFLKAWVANGSSAPDRPSPDATNRINTVDRVTHAGQFLLDRAEPSSVRSTRSCALTLPGQVNGSPRPRQAVWHLLRDTRVERLVAVWPCGARDGPVPRHSRGQAAAGRGTAGR